MPDHPQRRESDQVLAMMREQAKEDRDEAREFRTETRESHAMMLSKLECLPILAARLEHVGERVGKVEPIVPMVGIHNDWIENHGKPTEKKISELATVVSNTQAQVSGGVKGLKLGLMLGASATGGAGIVAILQKMITAAFGALPH